MFFGFEFRKNLKISFEPILNLNPPDLNVVKNFRTKLFLSSEVICKITKLYHQVLHIKTELSHIELNDLFYFMK